jgi:hypothetical protein
MHVIFAPKNTEVHLTWESAIQYCNNLTTDGYTCWRLPTIFELGFLVHHYSDEVNPVDYWSSTERWDNSPGAYFIHVLNCDLLQSCWKEQRLAVRAVRNVNCEIKED